MKFKNDLPESGGKNYVKLKDGESIQGIFMGDPYDFFCIYENKKPVPVPEGTPGARFRFSINFMVKEGATYVPKIFEQTATVYRTLAELHKEYDLERTVVKITRKGSGISDTEYLMMPLRQEVPAETLALLKTIKLNDLGSLHAKSQAPQGGGDDWGTPPDDSEIPF